MTERLSALLRLQKLRHFSLPSRMRRGTVVLITLGLVAAVATGLLFTPGQHRNAVHMQTGPTHGVHKSPPSNKAPGGVSMLSSGSGSATGSSGGGILTTPKAPAKTSNANSSTTGTTSPAESAGGGGSGGGQRTTNCAPTPSACGFPDATNTGPSGCSSYTDMSGNTEITTDGTTISCVRLAGSFDVYANNVTIENSIITSSNWWGINLRNGYSGLAVLHDSVTGSVGNGPDNGGEDYAVSNGGNGNVEVGYSNISEFGDAISLGNGDIHDNYVHDLQVFIPLCGSSPCTYYQHTDDLISDGSDSAGLTVEHNTMFNQMTTSQGASAAIGLFADDGPVSNATVDDNLIAGGAYALYPGGGSTSSNIVITNNHFSTLY